MTNPEHGWLRSNMDSRFRARIEAAAARLKQHGASAVFLFGSATRGSLRDDSDVDFAVTGLPARVLFRAMAEASRILGRPIDLVDLDRDDAIAAALLGSGELQRVA